MRSQPHSEDRAAFPGAATAAAVTSAGTAVAANAAATPTAETDETALHSGTDVDNAFCCLDLNSLPSLGPCYSPAAWRLQDRALSPVSLFRWLIFGVSVSVSPCSLCSQIHAHAQSPCLPEATARASSETRAIKRDIKRRRRIPFTAIIMVLHHFLVNVPTVEESSLMAPCLALPSVLLAFEALDPTYRVTERKGMDKVRLGLAVSPRNAQHGTSPGTSGLLNRSASLPCTYTSITTSGRKP